jgi:hypothetical protein
MLSARTIYGEIFDNDEAFGLFCSIAASGYGEVIRATLRAAALPRSPSTATSAWP